MFGQPLSDEVHVWCVDLNRPSAEVDCLSKCLPPAEVERGRRFLREADSRRFLVSHSAMRAILASYLGISAAEVDFDIPASGKPELAARQAASGATFNLSHSEDIALLAVARNRAVGVDVERIRPLGEMESIVTRYFAPGEREAWRALDDHDRVAGFFRCWTRKEAYLKARGLGLSLGLDQFEVSLAAEDLSGVVREREAIGSPDRWLFYHLSPCDGYVAACVTRPGATIMCVDWTMPTPSPR